MGQGWTMKLKITFYAESSDAHPNILANATRDFRIATAPRDCRVVRRHERVGFVLKLREQRAAERGRVIDPPPLPRSRAN